MARSRRRLTTIACVAFIAGALFALASAVLATVNAADRVVAAGPSKSTVANAEPLGARPVLAAGLIFACVDVAVCPGETRVTLALALVAVSMMFVALELFTLRVFRGRLAVLACRVKATARSTRDVLSTR